MSRSAITLLFLVASLPAVAQAQDKTLLTVKGKEGSFGRYKSETTVTFDAGGKKLTIVAKDVTKVTVTKVESNGNVTFEHKEESSETTIDGEKLPSDGKSSTTVTVLRPDGTLVSMKTDGDEPDDDHLDVRLGVAHNPVFSPKPVGVGEKWKTSYKADGTLGTKAAEAEFEYLANEDAGGVKCAKIRMAYKETGSGTLISNKATLWVELASGDVVKEESDYDGIPLPGPTGPTNAHAVSTSQRTAGGPLPGTGPAASAAPEPKDIDEVTKGCEKLPGAFTLYRKRESGRQTIYLEIRQDQIGKLTMLQATASSGNGRQLVTGSPIGDLVFQFEELQPDKLTMVVPNLAYRADAGTPEARAVERSFARSFLEQYTVEARSKSRASLLIDVSDLFRGDIARLSAVFQGGGNPMFGGTPGYSMDREKTYVASLKAFPKNVVAETVYNFVGGGPPSIEQMLGGGGGDPRSQVVRVVYNVFPLETTPGYVPRLYDSRIGFFTVWYQDFSRMTQLDQQVQYINRWRVRKSDPQAASSPAADPIVFWMDNAVPDEYRESLTNGILVWNKAFEKLGITGAVQVKQMPADVDWDPSDMRYNTIRWVASESDAYAVSQFRVDPVTGEIINGNILVDANLVRALTGERNAVVAPAGTMRPTDCRYVQDGMKQARLGLIAASALSSLDHRIDAPTYVKQFLHNVITHEFGHMLGLRHNFAASCELSAVQLGDAAIVQDAQPAASVMDYVPFNIEAIGKDGIDYYGQGIGKYDVWAVEYGYRDFGATSPTGEKTKLQEIAARCNEPGLAFQTDEAADGFDPYVTRFDMSSEPQKYWTRVWDVSKTLMGTLGDRRPSRGESYYGFTREFSLLMSLQGSAALQLTRFVGGLRRNANLKGDTGERPPLEPLSKAVQESALNKVCELALSPSAFQVPKSYLLRLTDDPNANLAETYLGGVSSFPAFDMISGLQAAVLDQLMDPDRMARVVNNEFKAERRSAALSLASVFDKVQSVVWTELGTGAEVTPLRRQLQRRHVENLARLAVRSGSGVPADAKMWAWDGLRDLAARLEKALATETDRTERVHYADCLARVKRAMQAQETVGGASARPSLSDLLGGGDGS
ncbi:MAG: zinc-dependent metalloprotease [Armatimonadetes bacterium]|nr:zinc-dependent metalloprotease [Armatimonadota bacterium]